MVAFLMLGIIPGTNIQITFASWVWLVAAIISIATLKTAIRKHRIVALFVALSIRHAVKAAKPALQLA